MSVERLFIKLYIYGQIDKIPKMIIVAGKKKKLSEVKDEEMEDIDKCLANLAKKYNS